jgi:hypothetical protein
LGLETNSDPDPVRIQGQKYEKKSQLKKKLYFFYQKLQFTYPQAFMKYVQVTEEAFRSQKRPSNTSKHELLPIFSYFCGSFLPSSGSRSTGPIESGSNPDPDPKPCVKLYLSRAAIQRWGSILA